MKIPLRTFQRQTTAFTDLLATNEGLWAEVVDGAGKVLFLASSPKSAANIGDIKDPQVAQARPSASDTPRPAATIVNRDTVVASEAPGALTPAEHSGKTCDLCQQPAVFAKWEDGELCHVCMKCVLAHKIPLKALKRIS